MLLLDWSIAEFGLRHNWEAVDKNDVKIFLYHSATMINIAQSPQTSPQERAAFLKKSGKASVRKPIFKNKGPSCIDFQMKWVEKYVSSNCLPSIFHSGLSGPAVPLRASCVDLLLALAPPHAELSSALMIQGTAETSAAR